MTVLEIYLEILTNFFEILYPPLMTKEAIVVINHEFQNLVFLRVSGMVLNYSPTSAQLSSFANFHLRHFF